MIRNSIDKGEDQEAAKKILGLLENEDAVVLTGGPGTGKTWLAKQTAKLAVTREPQLETKGHFYMSLWISLSLKQKNDDGLSLLQSVARQLSIFNVGSVWEDGEYPDIEKTQKFADDRDQLKDKVARKLQEKLKEMKEADKKNNEETNTFLLVVLDSEEDVTPSDFKYIMEEILAPPPPPTTTTTPPPPPTTTTTTPTAAPPPPPPPTTTTTAEVAIPCSDGDKAKLNIKFLMTSSTSRIPEVRAVEIEPFSGEDAVEFLQKNIQNDSIVSGHPKFQALRDAIKGRNKVLPAQIIMLAEAFKHIAKDGLKALDRALDTALDGLKVSRAEDAIPLLRFVYEALPRGLIDIFWHSWKLLGNHGGVQYNELIMHWMLEGYLDLADGIKKAYYKGFDVMTELVDRGMLKLEEDNLIVLERAMLTLEDRNCREFYETSNLGMAGLLEGKDSKVFERMAPTDDGMMKTASVDKEGKSVSSLLIDGIRLSREEPDVFFEPKQDLKVLALINPRMTKLPEPISKMKNLLLLVLRGCYLLNTVDSIKDLEALVILEISGAPSLTEMREDLFEKMTKLRSLNLSALGIKSLPNVSSLAELRRLIIRKCRFLQELPRLVNLKKIEVIDVSGSCSLIKLQEKCFQAFKELRVVDFSYTKIEKLPIVQTLPKLTLILVKGCHNLAGMRFMKHLPKLKVLDVEGGTRIKEIYYDCFDDTYNLRVLDLSETDIRFLPDSLGKHLYDLRLRGCSKLEKLLDTKDLLDLRSLDLSYSSGLKMFPVDFFDKLTKLESLNLSNSKVKFFPSLSKLCNLKRLLLKGCSFERLPDPDSKTFGSFKGLTNLVELDLSDCKSQAEQLPSLEDQKLLEVIDLSGYGALSEIDASFEHMPWLRALNLSGTMISSLPSLCKSDNMLHSLVLYKCTKLQNAPDFGTLPELEELDLRGTSSLKDIKAESLSRLSGLKTLRLSKAAFEGIQDHLEKLKQQLEVLDLSGEFEATSLTSSLDHLTNLKQLLLRGCSRLKELPLLNSLSGLEVLDLSGTEVSNLGEAISKLTNIKRLLHSDEKAIEDLKVWEKFKVLPLEIKLDRCNCISKRSEIPEEGKKPMIVVHGKELLTELKNDSALLDSIRRSISSVRAQCKDEDNYSDGRKHIFGDIYSKFRKLPLEDKHDQPLEIHGFDQFPTDIEVLFEQAKYLILVENDFLKNLSDLKLDSSKNIKGCWLERCNNMRNMFMEADLGNWETLEILWISNLPGLKSLYEDKVQSRIKHLYIDCCPTLETVFPSGGIPGNLETLQITFCDKVKTLFGDKVNDAGSVDKDKKGEASSETNLKHLSISNCPMLETVFSSGQVPKNLGILSIKYCDKLKSVFSQNCKLPNLQTLHLLDLPDLTTSSIGISNVSAIKDYKDSGLKKTAPSNEN